MRKSIFDLGTGSTFPNVNLKSLSSINISIPPLSQQLQIVKTLNLLSTQTQLLQKPEMPGRRLLRTTQQHRQTNRGNPHSPRGRPQNEKLIQREPQERPQPPPIAVTGHRNQKTSRNPQINTYSQVNTNPTTPQKKRKEPTRTPQAPIQPTPRPRRLRLRQFRGVNGLDVQGLAAIGALSHQPRLELRPTLITPELQTCLTSSNPPLCSLEKVTL